MELNKSLAKLALRVNFVSFYGDFNISVLNADSHVPTNDFIDLIYS